MTEEKREACVCVFDGITVWRYVREARWALDVDPGRAIIYADYAADEMPKLEKCLEIDLSDISDSLRKIRETIDRREEAKRWADRAERRLMRRIRECAGR